MRSHVLSVLVSVFISALLLTSCKQDQIQQPDHQPLNSDFYFSAAPVADPCKAGPWKVLSETYKAPTRNVGNNAIATNIGLVYYPQQANAPKAPLILFLHGNNTGGHNNYSVLCSHLASNGFYVASIAWPSGDYKADTKINFIKSCIISHINFLYNSPASPLKDKLNNDIVLMGHSRGGGAVVSFAKDIAKVKNIKSIIALAPSPADLDMQEKFSLTNETTSFFAIYGSKDPDVYGGMDVQSGVRKTGYKFFDEAGDNWGNVAFTKDMVLMSELNHITFCDTSYDNLTKTVVDIPRRQAIGGYINAFLKLHINKIEAYNQFFKYQQKLPSVNSSIKVSLQHADGDKLMLTNFENDKADKVTHYNGVITHPPSTTSIFVDLASKLDPTSMHATKVMSIAWQQVEGKPNPVVDFPFQNGENITSYKYLSMRAGIIPHTLNDQNKAQSFYIQLHDAKGQHSYCVPVLMPVSFFSYATRSYMQSFLLPLTAFKGIDLKTIKSVSFVFLNKSYPKGCIMIDNLEFYK